MSLDLESNFPQNNLKVVKPSGSIIYGFEDFRFDAAHLMLYRDGKEVQLTPKQADTLLALIEQRGEIVSKEALMIRLWGDAAVEESNLIQNIHILRKDLGNTRGGQAIIETFRRRGYRFNAAVTFHKHRLTEVSAGLRLAELEEIPEPAALITPDALGQIDTSTKISNRRAVSAVTGAVLFIVLAIVVFLAGRPTTIDTVNKKFAILPLTPIDPANRNILYELGIADSLIRRLNPAKGIIVRSIGSVRKYNEAEPDPLEAGRDLKVDYIMESNYQISDGQIKVTAQILNVATGKVEDTFTSSADSENLFTAQETITNDIGKRLVARFGSDAADNFAKRGTNSDEAYRAYLLAMNLSEERGIQNLQKCLAYLEQAVALDPDYANAWAAIAQVHGDMIGHTDTDQEHHYAVSMEAINKALAIDPNLSAAHSARCYFKNRYEYNAIAAESECKRALELEPNSALAHKTFANFLYSQGRFDEAIAEIRTAIELQPVSYRNQQIYGLALYFARRFPEAEAQFKHLLELNPNHAYINGQLVTILDAQGKESDAFDYVIKTLTAKNVDDRVIEHYKAVYAKMGWRGVTMERIKTSDVETIPGSFKTACLYTKLGDKDKAFELLEKAFKEHSFQITNLKVEPQLDPLRNDPRFNNLVSRVENH
jgi:DNA-binding winged helix-turn-helix (wHTH) protein/Tfp pilus assembly protein PilF/TolB-like protein